MHILRVYLMIILAGIFCSVVEGATDGQETTVSPLFLSHDPLTLSISAPFQSIHRDRGSERSYYPATMVLPGNDGKETRLDLEIRVRGNFRAKRETCTYPPLHLNFKRKSLADTVFEGENILKLVAQCKNSDSYAQYLLLEYLIYRVYQLFTDYSLKVRLVTVNYYDTDKESDLGTRPAFFIEDSDRMAGRAGLRELKVESVDPGDYDQAMVNLVDVFEYFIGNTDWSTIAGPEDDDCCHNIIPMRRDARTLVPVPYDFDLAGVVNAPYAVVSDMLPIRTVRQRLYRGFCQDDRILRATLAAFADNRDEITALYNNQTGLSDRSRNSALEYYDDFYGTVSNEKKLRNAILDKCR